MNKVCDHTSVAMIVRKGDSVLLIERKKYPFGFAPPAGHVDGDKDFETAARRELKEEVGLDTTSIRLIYEGRRENQCRRQDGSWHYWKVYEVETSGILKRSVDETRQAKYCNKKDIKDLSELTKKYINKQISDSDWEQNPGLEVNWYEFSRDLKIFNI